MRLIDTDELKYSNGLEECPTGQYVTIADIRNAKTIDAVPVVHGHWEKERIGADKIDKCSVCGGSYLPCIKSCNYCPFCGAKMDEVTG